MNFFKNYINFGFRLIQVYILMILNNGRLKYDVGRKKQKKKKQNKTKKTRV